MSAIGFRWFNGIEVAAHTEECPTLGVSDAHAPAVALSYGSNPQGGGMNPFDRELGETQSVCHQGGVMQVQCYDGYNQMAHKEVSMTIRRACSGGERNDATPKVAYGIDPVERVRGGETPFEELSRTLDAGNGRGGSGVSQTIGFKAGQSADGGLGDEREVSPTLSHKPSALEPTAAIYPACADTLRRRNDGSVQPDKQNGAAFVAQSQCDLSQMRYIVRRLTPTEAERLMGLPDGYTIPRGLRITDELVVEFQRIFDTFGAIMAEYEHKPAPKPKSANQVRAWLEKITDPANCPDSPRYKACGNGWATNQPRWILTRLLALGEGIDPFTGEEL